MFSILLLIAVSLALGVALGASALSWSINWMISRGVMDIFYNGERSEEFKLW